MNDYSNEITQTKSASKFGKTTSAAAIIFALVTLFNPNINIVDIIPDFLGYFILFSVFTKAADCAPFFQEARGGFCKLGLVSLMKIPALVITVFARSKNTLDNDIIVLMALLFMILEIIFLIPTVNNIFSALSYLGERSDASSLISEKEKIEDLKILTFIFLIGKSVLGFLPETLRLTRSVESGSQIYLLTGSKYYGPALTASLLFSLILGIIWLSKSIKYVKKVKSEGKFDSALLSVASESAADEYEKNKRRRSLYLSFALISFASVFAFRLNFENYHGVNLIPPTLYGILMLLGVYILSKHVSGSVKLKIFSFVSSILYIASSTAAYWVNNNFLIKYGYSSLYMNTNQEAVEHYKNVMILTLIELVFLITFFISFVLIMRKYFFAEILIPKDDERYSKQDKEYEILLTKKTVLFSGFGISVGIVKFINVCLHSKIQLIFTDPSNITMPTITAPSLPWFSTLVFFLTLIYVLYSFYYFGFVKTELNETAKHL